MRVARPLLLLGVVFVTGCLALAPAHAAGLRKGAFEISPSLAVSHASISYKGSGAGISTSAVALGGEFGYCLTPMFELVAEPLLAYESVKHVAHVFGDTSYARSTTGVGARAGLKVNFGASDNVLPYVSAGAGIMSFSGDGYEDTDLQLEAPIVRVGLRLMAGPAAGVDFFGGYSHISNFQGVKDVSSNRFALGVGMTLFPGRR